MFNFRGAPGHLRVQRILSKLSSAGLKPPTNFIDRFVQAESIFFHHIIFNPNTERCEFLLDESHSNCQPDIFKRVLDSLGIANGGGNGREIDVESGGDDTVSLHTAATLTSSFLGVVLSSEIVRGIYEGSICPRTLRSLTEAHNDDDDFRPSSPSPTAFHADYNLERERTKSFDDDALKDYHDPDSDDEMSSALLQANFQRPDCAGRAQARQEAKQPSPETLERKRTGQAKQRSSTFKSLLSVYAKTDNEDQLASTPSKTVLDGGASLITPASTAAPTISRSSSSWLLDRISAAPSEMNASNKRPIDDANDDTGPSYRPNTRSRSTTTSFQALVEKNRVSSDSKYEAWTPLKAKLPGSSSSAAKSEPPPAKKQRIPVSSASKKPTNKSASASKAKPRSSGTLFQFFQKQ